MKPREFWIAPIPFKQTAYSDVDPYGRYSVNDHIATKVNPGNKGFIHVREVLTIPKNDLEINEVHLKQLAEELIHKNPNGAMYISPQIVKELLEDKLRLEWIIKEQARFEVHRGYYFVCFSDGRDFIGESEEFKSPREAIDAAMKKEGG